MPFHSPSEADTIKFAADLAQNLAPGSVLLLQGPLGAGKTTFVRGLLQGLDSKNKAKSPTYTIMREYDSPRGQILHLDLYRLQNYEEITALGWPEIAQEYFLTIIEWPERLGNTDIPSSQLINFDIEDKDSRNISIKTN